VLDGEPYEFINVIEADHSHCREPIHRECGIRRTVGSVGHQTGRCTCFVHNGEAYDDPPEMTRRQAARAAADVFFKMQRG
jgi:hypothetical protein